MESQQAPERLGRYRILKEIGRGGMATVYHAVQEGPHGFENHVALKLIHEKLLAAYPRVVKMLVDEARVAARIHHPNVMRILDLVEQENRVYMVMDYVDGISMRGVLDHARETRTRPAIAPVLEVLADACSGIHAAHQLKAADGTYLNLVHRDMKPGNIMVSIEGHVKVGDFGIALFADRMADSTAQGQLKGTPAYMSPEQTLGGPLDARSDVFSMGLTLYTLSTTKLAFRAKKAMQIALKIARESLEPHAVELEGIVPGLGDILRKACARDPDDRFQDAVALGDALREVHGTLDEQLSISEMLKAAGWQPAPAEPARQSGGSLQPGLSDADAVSLLEEPIEGPEENELTETVNANEAEGEVDTNTYIPTVTELNTDLEATPIAPARPDQTEPAFPTDANIESDPQPATATAPVPATRSDAVPVTAPPLSAKYVANRTASQPTQPSGRIILHERDHRGRVVPAVRPEQTRVGQGEKFGIAITAVFLLVAVTAIVVYQLTTPDSKNDSQVPAQSNILEGGIVIAEGEDLSSQTAATIAGDVAETEDADAGITIEEELIVNEPLVIKDRSSAEEGNDGQGEEPDKSEADSKPNRVPPDEPVERRQKEDLRPQAAVVTSDSKRERVRGAGAQGPEAIPQQEVQPAEQEPATLEPGLLTVNSYPWSEVHVDGTRVGVTPLQEHSLPAGIHSIRLVFPGAGNREIVEKVEIRPAKHLRIVKKLPTSEQTADD